MPTDLSNRNSKDISEATNALQVILEMRHKLLNLSQDPTLSKKGKRRFLKARKSLNTHSISLASDLCGFGIDKQEISNIILKAEKVENTK